jgi:aminoglycoside phosphotransferase (APT) family kinase protein
LGVWHEVLKHTPGKRCVVAYHIESGDDSGVESVIGKLYREDRGAKIFEQLRLLRDACRANNGVPVPFGMLEPLAYVPGLGMVLQSVVPGASLSRFGEHDDWCGAMRRVADNLAALHDLPASLGEPKSMADLIRKFCRPGPAALKADHPELAPWVDHILQRLEAVDPRREGRGDLVHGDLGLGQIFVTTSRAFFVDFDGLCRSHAALDVGNFLVSLRMRLGPGSAEPERIFTERYLENRPAERLGDLQAYQALAYLRRATTCLRTQASPDWRERGERLLRTGSGVAS